MGGLGDVWVTKEMLQNSNIKEIKNLSVSVTWGKDFSSSQPRYPPKIYKH